MSNEVTNPASCQTAVSGSCKCSECGREFQEYEFTEDCWNCNGDGEVEKEMEWEYEPSLYTCSTCKGKGHVTYKVSNLCNNCKWKSVYDNDEDVDEDNYCSNCGHSCNYH